MVKTKMEDLIFECRICSNKKNNKSFEAKEMMFGTRDSFIYFQCDACNCLQIADFPPNISKYYPQNYNGHESSSESPFKGLKGKFRKIRYNSTLFPKSTLNKIINKIFPTEQYEILGKKIDLNLNIKILDVGGGGGSYLMPLYELGIKNTLVIDPFVTSGTDKPNALKIVKGYIFDLNDKWDVIMYNHSFEHVPDPLENLLAVQKLMDIDGTCIIRIPTVSSFAWKHYKTNWFQLDAPRHFFLHSVESINLLADKAGLEVVDIIYDSSYIQFTGSENYKNNIAMNEKSTQTLFSYFKKKFNNIKYGIKASHLNKINQGDQAAFFLKKKLINTN